MKIGFICPPVPGHFNPMSALARQLQSRNHDVVAISLPVSEPFARAANLPFVPFGEKEFSAERFAETVATGKTHPPCIRVTPGLRSVLGNLTLKALIGRATSITQVPSMMEKVG